MLRLVWLLFAATPTPPGPPHCPAGFDSVGGEACLAAPKRFDPNKLVIYFHGILPPYVDWAVVQEFKVLGPEATRRGYALLAMRGEQGLCSWGDKFLGYWCWPSDKTQQSDMERMLRRLKALMPRVSERLNSRIGPPILLGFSNGGFFVSMIAAASKLDVRAYGVLHGGGASDQGFSPARARPTILCAASSDEIQLPTMKRLLQTMKDCGWKPHLSLRDGEHEVTQSDANAAFDFFESLNP